MKILKKLLLILQKKTKTSSSGQISEEQQQLIYLLQELNQRFSDFDRQISEMQKSSESLVMTSGAEEEYLENLQIIFAEELYQELCKELESGRMIFMGIA